MRNYSNNSCELNIRNYYLDSVLMEQITVFITFEICIVLISLLIVSSSSLVIYQIIKTQAKKAKYDFAFIILSVSDIVVGLTSVPMVGIRWYYARILQDMLMSVVSIFFQCFPYNFSYLFTVAIAVDRLIVIRLSPKYKNLFTPRMLKVIAIIMFLITITSNSILTITAYNFQSSRCITFSVHYIFPVLLNSLCAICTVVVILIYLYILYFALKSPDLNVISENRSKSCNRKRLTSTISWICISQLICVIPFLLFQILVLNGCIPDKLFSDINPWLTILIYSQCFWNAVIIHKNIKNRKIFKQKGKEEIAMNCKSRIRTR